MSVSKTITIEFPVDVQRGNSGLFYVTSPLVRALLVSERTEEEALAKVPQVLADMAAAQRDLSSA